MNSKQLLIVLAGIAASGGGVRAATNETSEAEAPVGWNWAMGEGVTHDGDPVVSTEVYIGFDSKYLSYGLVDNNDPIWTYGGEITFCDWVTLGSFAIHDMSRYGVNAGYKNRQGKAIEYHPTANVGHAFGPDDFAWLPTTVEFSFGFDYEYHPRVCTEGAPRGGDTYFYTFEVSLPDLWVEPTFLWEHDGMRDHGNYLNIELGHTFALIDGEGEADDPILAFRPSVGQGWGDRRRICAYLQDHNRPIYEENDEGELELADYEPLEHDGLMDTCFKGELTWNLCAGVSLSGYVAYSDYLFDPATRKESRYYEATGAWNDSWNFVTGATLSVAF